MYEDEYLIAIPMNSTWNWKTNISISLYAKATSPNPRTGTAAPVLSSGALYSGSNDDNRIYLYGGTTSFINTSFPGYKIPYTQQYSLWSYDTIADEWDQFDVTESAPERPSNGAYADAPDLGLAFYLNGQIDNGSSYQTSTLDDSVQVPLEGMIVLDTSNATARNVSTFALTGSNSRTKGMMQYIPKLGGSGILVYLGGSYKSIDATDDEDIGTLVSYQIKIDHCEKSY